MATPAALQRCPILPPPAYSHGAFVAGKQLYFGAIISSGNHSTAYQAATTGMTALVSFQLLRRRLGPHSFSISSGGP